MFYLQKLEKFKLLHVSFSTNAYEVRLYSNLESKLIGILFIRIGGMSANADRKLFGRRLQNIV